MRTLALVMVLSTLGCDDGAPFGDDGTPCPSAETAGGWFPVNDGTAGVYHVEIAQGDVHLMAGFPHVVPEPTPALPRDVRAFVAPDRWLRLTIVDGVRVQECRRGGTEDGACDELGPPTGGRLVAYRDGVQIAEFTLWTPSWPIGAPIAGCPQLYNGHIAPAR